MVGGLSRTQNTPPPTPESTFAGPRLRANGTFVAPDRPNAPFTPSGADTPPTHHPVRDRVNDTLTLLNEGNGTFTPSGQELGEEDAAADARSDLLAKV